VPEEDVYLTWFANCRPPTALTDGAPDRHTLSQRTGVNPRGAARCTCLRTRDVECQTLPLACLSVFGVLGGRKHSDSYHLRRGRPADRLAPRAVHALPPNLADPTKCSHCRANKASFLRGERWQCLILHSTGLPSSHDHVRFSEGGLNRSTQHFILKERWSVL
jgi:hypothetical protein